MRATKSQTNPNTSSQTGRGSSKDPASFPDGSDWTSAGKFSGLLPNFQQVALETVGWNWSLSTETLSDYWWFGTNSKAEMLNLTILTAKKCWFVHMKLWRPTAANVTLISASFNAELFISRLDFTFSYWDIDPIMRFVFKSRDLLFEGLF